MCQGSDNYQYSDPLFVGGASGNYTVQSPMPQGFHAEWAVVAVTAGGAAGSSTVILSADLGQNANPTIAVDGSQNIKNALPGVIIQIQVGNTVHIPEQFFPLKTNDLQVLINAASGAGVFVTVRFRWRITPLTTLTELSEEPDVDDWQEHRANEKHAQKQEVRLAELMTKVGPGNFYGR